MIPKLDSFLFGEVARARTRLLAKVLLGLLGLDCVVDLVPHGGRYGVGGFNVAHFAFLDALLPTPTAARYVGTLFVVGTLSLVSVFGRTRRSIVGLVALAYTLAWVSSLLDSYQHHYLLSLLLVSLATLDVGAFDGRGERASAPSYVAMLVTIAIVYAFAVVTKLEPEFVRGHALERLTSPSELDRPFAILARLRLDTRESYALLACAAIVLEALSACFVLVATSIDRGSRARRWRLATLGLVPIAFHLGVSALDLDIGWFTRYMIAIHVVAFAPTEVVTWLDGVIARAASRIATGWTEPFAVKVLVVVVLVVAPLAYVRVDLPGAAAGGLAAMGVVALVALVERRGAGALSAELPLAVVGSAIVILVSVSHPRLAIPIGGRLYGIEAATVRYDYYRFVGGDAMRRDRVAEAIAAYRKARRYAPDDVRREETDAKLARLREGR